MSEAAASHVSRYRPAVFAITGVAAACGIYILYNTYADQPTKSSLHRSNAVHRGRPERPTRTVVDFTRPTAESPIGDLTVTRNSESMVANLWLAGVFDVEEVRTRLEIPANELTQQQLNETALRSLLTACSYHAQLFSYRQRLDEIGLGRLCDALLANDENLVMENSEIIANMLGHVTQDEIIRVSEDIIEARIFAAGAMQNSESEDVTYAETEDVDATESEDMEPSQGLKGLLYHIAETDAKRKAYEHRGIHCEGCGERPIRGVRWHCLNCPDFDLCSTCEADNDHIKTHVFAKVKIPLPVLSQPTKEVPLWYPGDPRKMHPPLKASVKKTFQEEYELDGPSLDAFYDQFTCIANMPLPADPDEIKGGIDRRAFNKAMTSERWPGRFRPNAIYDRMFAFYDTNKDGLISFREFVNGMVYLRGPKRFTPFSRAIEGFDIDGDGCVDRKDFIRLLRAKHEIQKLIIEDMIEGRETQNTRSAMDALRSSQPISAIFSWDEIPQGEERPPQGKVQRNGDMEPLPETKTVLEDNEGWNNAAATQGNRTRRSHRRRRPHERLQDHMSRFEEMLDSPSTEANGIHVSVIDGSTEPSASNGRQPNWSSNTRDDVMEDGRTPTADGSDSGESDAPLNQDVLWQVIEEGFQELLDPLFDVKEAEDEEVEATREERQKWRREIEDVASKEAKLPDLSKADANEELVDPLVAMAMHAGMNGSTFVPTDSESLTRREEEIARKPLDELLDATGYSTVDGEGQGGSNTDIESAQPNGSQALQDSPPDPTMPQNKPNSSRNRLPSDDEQIEFDDMQTLPKDPDKLPSELRLGFLHELNKRERSIKMRGGPGRLTYGEVEERVKADETRELKGLVTSWLEWASF